MRILIAYDGSDCARAAIEDLRCAGLPADSEAFVLSVAELIVSVGALPNAEFSDSDTMSHMVREARRLARDAIADAREMATAGADLVASRFPGWRVQSGAEADTPYAAIIHKAEEWPADLVVVGSHGRSPLGRLILGSVSQKVLGHAPCSVRVGRCVEAGARPVAPGEVPPPRVLLAVDASSGSALAADAVRLRSWPKGTEVRVITAVDLKLLSSIVTHGVGHGYDPNADPNLTLRRGLEMIAQVLRDVGLTADPVLVDGDPKRAIVEEAERWGADCVFLGAKGHGRLARFLLGSVSSAVAARAHCSVEVVRQG